MTIKLIGAILVIIGCGGFGFYIAALHRREERILRQMLRVIDYISCELRYRMTPLPQLCRQASIECSGILRTLFSTFASEMDKQICPDTSLCMKFAVSQCSDLPSSARQIVELLGQSLGRFHLEGQLKELNIVHQACSRKLTEHSQNRESRLRVYQTLSLCAGAALVILFI